MAFLTKDELKTVSTSELINKITAYDDSIVNAIIDESIGLMCSYLSKYYDTDAIFSATGNARHKTVLKKLKDIVIFEIYERHTREINQAAKRRFDEAMLWLEKLNTGEFADRTLPPITETSEETETPADILFGNRNDRYSSNY